MDSVLGDNPGSRRGENGDKLRLAGQPGRRTITLSQAGTVRIRSCLSTWRPARLGAELNGETLLSWERNSDTDPSPLKVKGKDDPASMHQPKTGDWSPNARTHSFEVPAGGKLTIFLEGEWGDAEPFIEILGAGNQGESTKPGGDNSSDAGRISGAATAVQLDFSRDWTLEVKTVVTSTSGFARIFCGDGSVHNRRIDLVSHHEQGLHFRLANKAIQFTSARVGKVHNPGANKDHWFDLQGQVKKGQSYVFRIEYRAGGSFRFFQDGTLIGDGDFTRKKTPATLTKIVFPCARGSARMI